MNRRGIGVSAGIAVGKAIVTDGQRVTIPRRSLASDECAREQERLEQAVTKAKADLEAARDTAESELGEEAARLLAAQRLMLDDDHLVGEALRTIARRQVNAEWALAGVIEHLSQQFRAVGERLFRERERDIRDVGDRLQHALGGRGLQGQAEPEEEYILVAHDPAPSQAAQLRRSRLLGMAVDVGGHTSHVGIIAKSLEIPAVVGLGDITRNVRTGDQLIIDGSAGEVVVNPSRTVINEYLTKKEAQEKHETSLRRNRDLPTITADGYKVFLQANVDFPDEVEAAGRHGAEGIGLYRSEFLYLDHAVERDPSEDHQYEIYKTLAERVYPRSAIVRTIDFGGGKVDQGSEVEANPILGLRAIRYCLQNPEIFRTQLRALLRASTHGRLKIMFPMISSVSELRMAKAVLEQAKAELRAEKTEYNTAINVGIMIEVPAAAAIADLLAREVDFFSIGTNDLIQYLLAIDRDNTEVAYLYEPLHPAVLRTLKFVVDSAHRNGIRVGMCGEMAAEPRYVPLLVGLGLDELSMNPMSIPLVKNIIRSIERKEAIQIVDHALRLATAQEVEEYVRERVVSRFPDGYV